MITKYGRHDMIYQQAIGYSCVLFAWIVVVSIRMNKFCPIIFLPDMCFNNMSIPLDVLSFGLLKPLPINFGPIILLVVTKIILPRSSFIGHLSGIIIGYPLAWNLLNWLTPPLLISISIIILIYKYKLYSIYNNTITNNNNDDDSIPIKRYYYIKIIIIILILCNLIYITIINSHQIILYLLSSYLACIATYALKNNWTKRQLHIPNSNSNSNSNNSIIILNSDVINKLISISLSEMTSLLQDSSYLVSYYYHYYYYYYYYYYYLKLKKVELLQLIKSL